MGRSMCVHCRRTLAWYENVPIVSFLALGGKCRTCLHPIPKHYPLVEIAMGVLLTLVFAYHVSLPVFKVGLFWRDIFFTTLLVVIFVYDALYMIILPRVVWLGAVVGFVFNYFVLGIPLRSLIIGALIGGGIFLIQFIISRGRWIGGGDVRLGFMMGVWLGYPSIVVALFIAYVVGAICGVLLLAFKKKTWQAQIPFGTFLAIGTLASLYGGTHIIQWYVGLIAG